MSYPEALDQVAKNNYCAGSYREFEELYFDDTDRMVRLHTEAAELYARAKHDECQAKIKEELEYMFSVAGGTVSAHYLFKHLPKPEFKP